MSKTKCVYGRRPYFIASFHRFGFYFVINNCIRQISPKSGTYCDSNFPCVRSRRLEYELVLFIYFRRERNKSIYAWSSRKRDREEIKAQSHETKNWMRTTWEERWQRQRETKRGWHSFSLFNGIWNGICRFNFKTMCSVHSNKYWIRSTRWPP